MEITNIKSVGKFIVSKSLQREIDFLHASIGAKEWSGILVYSTDNKDISSLENLSFTGHHLYLMDVGTAAATEFNYDKNVIDLYDKIPEAIDMNIGLTHSHHSMSAYFSPTDDKEIKDNASLYNYYISLVVCFTRKYACKIAFPAECLTKKTISIKGYDGESIKEEITEGGSAIITSSLEVEFEEDNSPEEWFTKRYDEVKKAPIISTPITSKYDYKTNTYTNYADDDNWNKDNKYFKGDNYGLPAPVENDDLRFALSMIAGRTIYPSEFEKSTPRTLIKKFRGFDGADFLNMSIIHDNIYGVNEIYNEIPHVKSAISHLNSYKKEFPLLNKIISRAYEYIKYAGGE